LRDTLLVRSGTAVKMKVNRNTLVGDLLADPHLSSTAKKLLDKVNETHPFAQMGDEGNMAEMLAAMRKYMPLRALVNFGGGAFTEEMMDEMIETLNAASSPSSRA